MTNLLLFWITKDNLPLDFVEGEGFKAFMKEALPHYKAPGRKRVTKLLDEKYKDLYKKIKAKLSKDVKYVSLTTDIWTYSETSKSYVDLTAHYYNADSCKIDSNILAVEPLDESHTADYIRNIVGTILKSWDIPDSKVKYAMTDGGANMKKGMANF